MWLLLCSAFRMVRPRACFCWTKNAYAGPDLLLLSEFHLGARRQRRSVVAAGRARAGRRMRTHQEPLPVQTEQHKKEDDVETGELLADTRSPDADQPRAPGPHGRLSLQSVLGQVRSAAGERVKEIRVVLLVLCSFGVLWGAAVFFPEGTKNATREWGLCQDMTRVIDEASAEKKLNEHASALALMELPSWSLGWLWEPANWVTLARLPALALVAWHSCSGRAAAGLAYMVVLAILDEFDGDIVQVTCGRSLRGAVLDHAIFDSAGMRRRA